MLPRVNPGCSSFRPIPVNRRRRIAAISDSSLSAAACGVSPPGRLLEMQLHSASVRPRCGCQVSEIDAQAVRCRKTGPFTDQHRHGLSPHRFADIVAERDAPLFGDDDRRGSAWQAGNHMLSSFGAWRRDPVVTKLTLPRWGIAPRVIADTDCQRSPRGVFDFRARPAGIERPG